MRARGQGIRAIEAGITLFAEEMARLVWVTPEDVWGGWDCFRSFEDKGWSFTDCVSRAVIERLGLRQAFSFDKHFHQFGSVEVVP